MSWVTDIFRADQAANGGIVRRSIASVQQYATIEEVVDAAKQRGFHVIITGDQVVILCHPGEMIVLC